MRKNLRLGDMLINIGKPQGIYLDKADAKTRENCNEKNQEIVII
ncbi:MAG: hypothetical protein PHF82_10720 [Lutispora sp.]|nr:hypothetical protein [Lutispora sp.]